jgi:SAM-dependent methyltransferase
VIEDHVLLNRREWDADADNWVERGREAWAQDEPSWGIWPVPESEVGLLPEVDGSDVVELGCGTAYISAWLARRGARPVGLDNSSRQLATARRFQEEFGIRFPLVHADGERPPFRDESFDFAISEYGASIWCDPYRWIPEAARILRQGGRLLFIVGGAIMMCCYPTDDDEAPADTRLHRDYFGMHRFEWHDEDGRIDAIEFHLTHGDMIRLLRSSGFEIEELVEMQAPEQRPKETTRWYVEWDWSRRWPSVEVWKARKR